MPDMMPDTAICRECKKTLRISHSIGKLGDSELMVGVFWCFECKTLIHFQFLGFAQQAIQTPGVNLVS